MKKPDILEKEFQGLLAMAWAPIDQMPVAQVDDLRSAFMAGAMAFLSRIMNDLDPGAGITPKDEQLLADMALELEVYRSEYAARHGLG